MSTSVLAVCDNEYPALHKKDIHIYFSNFSIETHVECTHLKMLPKLRHSLFYHENNYEPVLEIIVLIAYVSREG